MSLTNEGAGLGGSVRFFSTEVAGGYYLPVSEKVTLEFAGQVGHIHGIGQGVDVANAFFVGGDDLRGFVDGGIGPQDVVANDQLGGNNFFVGSVQLSFPLGLPEEYGLGGRVFTDFGTLFDTDASCGANPPATCDIADSRSLRASIGFGLTWNSFLGPIAVDLAYPVMKESYDKTEFFRFSVGTRF